MVGYSNPHTTIYMQLTSSLEDYLGILLLLAGGVVDYSTLSLMLHVPLPLLSCLVLYIKEFKSLEWPRSTNNSIHCQKKK